MLSIVKPPSGRCDVLLFDPRTPAVQARCALLAC
jgi:hypothetical protein